MRTIYTLALFTISFHMNVVFCQTTFDTAESSDAKAIDILKYIEEDYASAKSHLIDFDFFIEMPGGESQTYKGELLQAGEKFELDLNERKVISDNVTVWNYLKSDNEVQINDVDLGEDGDIYSPQSIFKLYKSGDFIFAISSYEREEGQAVTQIECKPLSSDSEYSKMRLTIFDKTKEVKRFKIFSKDGSRMTMTINTHKRDVKLNDNQFTFDAADYKDVLIEDLRF